MKYFLLIFYFLCIPAFIVLTGYAKTGWFLIPLFAVIFLLARQIALGRE